MPPGGNEGKKRTLKPRHQLFADRYLECFDAAEAARLSGLGNDIEGDDRKVQRGMEFRGKYALARPEVYEYIKAQLEARLRGHGLEKGRILKEMCRIALYDTGDVFDSKGRPKPLSKVSRDARAAIQGIKVLEEYETVDGKRVKVGTATQYIMARKDPVLKILAAHLGILPTDENEQKRTDRLDEVVAAMNAGPVETLE